MTSEDTFDRQTDELVSPNHAQLNGIKMNGIKMNGIKMNGIKMNGIKMNAITLSGTVLSGLGEDGQPLAGTDFIGADMDAEMEDGTIATVRIQDIEEIDGLYYYTIEYQNGLDWANICQVNTQAIPVDGTWNEHGDHLPDSTRFSFGCRGTAVAKCVEWGYERWETAQECLGASCQERSLADFHQACTRMVRADYCGDGVPHTEDSTAIDVWDALGILTETADSDLRPEAEWRTDGAACIEKTRWREEYGNATLEYILSHCPERWSGPAATHQCFMSSSDFFAVNGYEVPTSQRRILRNSSGINVRP